MSEAHSRRDACPNAILGDGSLLLTLSRRGEVEQLWWPNLDRDPQLGELRLAALTEDGGATWLDDPALHHEQRYDGDAKLLAGGQSLMVMVRAHLLEPRCLIGLERIPTLDALEPADGGLRLSLMGRVDRDCVDLNVHWFVDSHLELPEVAADRGRLESVELVPFRAAVEEGVDAGIRRHERLGAATRAGVQALGGGDGDSAS